MSELNIKSTLKDSNQFILQVSDIPGTVKKYPVKVTATLDNGSKVEQTKYITIKVSPTVSISGADKFTAQFGEGTAHYDFSYTPAKYNAPITVASVKSSNSSVTVSGISTSGFDLSVTGLTDSTTTTITATLLVDKTTVSLTKNITVEYQEDTSPFILYNVGESADVGIHKGGSIEMTKMYFKVVDDYTEGEEYDDSGVDYEIWENTSTNNTKTVATVGKNQALLLKAYEKKRWNTGPDSSYYSYFVLGSSGKFKAYGKIGALDGYYTKLGNGCYNRIFYNCKSLIKAPELPATTLGSYCYNYMFSGCTGLTTLPENLLPATTLGSYCYYSMFQSCKGLTTLPENLLPATTLASNCYDSMFSNCESLIKAPELPATTLAGQCYQNMFYGCTKLSYVKALFTTTPGSGYTSSWLYSVASAGTFIGNLAASWDVTGTSGVPTGWTHYNTITLSKPSIKANSDGTGSGHVTITSLLEPNSTASISLTKVEAPTSSDGCSLSFSNLSSTGFDVTVSGFTQDVIFTLTATLSVNGETVTKTTTFTVVKYVFVDGDEHFTLETSSSPAFTVASAATTNLNTYMAKVGGYLLYPKDNKVYATKLKADDWNYFSDGTDATSYVPKCETMIYLPKCHYASYGKKFIFGGLSTDYGTVFESPEWVGAYEMYVDSSGTGHSRPDQSPTRSKTIGAFWNCAQGLGTDWGLANYEFFCLINALYQTKYGNLDSQTQVGTGGTTSSFSSWMDVKMGYGRTLGDGSGSASTSMSGQNCVKLFGFEDLWAKCWEWRQGIWLSNSKIHVYNSNKVSSTESDREWDAVLKNSGNYISSCFLGENGHWDMLPKAVSGASNSYYCDYGYMSSSSGPLALYVGSISRGGSYCGVSCSDLSNDFSYSHSVISSRLSFYGTPEIVDATTFKSYLQ